MALSLLPDDAERLGFPMTAAQCASFERYRDLLLEWNNRAGLTTVTDPVEIERRHFGESLALLAVLRDAGLAGGAAPIRLADLGPGAGFPGVPMRIVDPTLHLTLIESHARRAAFLDLLVGELALGDVTVRQARAEDAGRAPDLRAAFDVVVARALAPLPVLVEYALPLLRDGGVLAAPKGSRALDELTEARGAIAALGGAALDPRPLPLPAGAPVQHVVLIRCDGPLDDRYPRRPGIPSKRPLR